MRITKSFFKKAIVMISVALISMTAMFNLKSCAPAEEEIEIGYVLWDCANASSHVVAAIIEDEFGMNVNLTSVDAGPMWMGLARGDFDAMVTAWLPITHDAYYEQTMGDVENLGANLDGARIGWVVPSYVDIDSIEEMQEHADKFDGEVTGIDPGAGIMSASEEALEAYDLDFNLLSGSDAAMTAALERAIEREEWIVVTGWTPHWKFASYDLKYLEDPKNIFGEEEYIGTIVHPGLVDKSSEVYQFLDNFYWTPEEIGVVMGYIEEGMDPMVAARTWIADNPDRVNQWLP